MTISLSKTYDIDATVFIALEPFSHYLLPAHHYRSIVK